MNFEAMKKVIMDDEFWEAFEATNQRYGSMSAEDREMEIIKFVDGYKKGVISLTVAAILASAVDPEEFERILKKHNPDFEAFFTELGLRKSKSDMTSQNTQI